MVNSLLETNLYTQNIEINISVALTATTKIELYLTVYDSLAVFCGCLCQKKNESEFFCISTTGFNVFLHITVHRLVRQWHIK